MNSFFESIQPILGGIRAVFILLDILLFGVFVYSLVKLRKYRPKFVFNPKRRKKRKTLRNVVNEERWKKILKKLEGGGLDSMKLAIIDADGLVDDVLKQMGLPGEHFADRLARLTPEELKTFDKVWTAHRVRNDLVHTPGFALGLDEARRVMKSYEAFLIEIKAI